MFLFLFYLFYFNPPDLSLSPLLSLSISSQDLAVSSLSRLPCFRSPFHIPDPAAAPLPHPSPAFNYPDPTSPAPTPASQRSQQPSSHPLCTRCTVPPLNPAAPFSGLRNSTTASRLPHPDPTFYYPDPAFTKADNSRPTPIRSSSQNCLFLFQIS